MKYPECCYRIGNVFELDGKTYLWKNSPAYTTEMFSNSKKSFNELMKNGKLKSITAETLAELAKENGEGVSIDFRTKCIKIYWRSERGTTIYMKRYYKEYYEDDFNKTLLRVAKERNYIK